MMTCIIAQFQKNKNIIPNFSFKLNKRKPGIQQNSKSKRHVLLGISENMHNIVFQLSLVSVCYAELEIKWSYLIYLSISGK